MLTRVARFEFRYLLRNPLLWVSAAAAFAMYFVSVSTGVELGSEGGLLQNAAYATLRNYLLASIFFMFVTTSFVADAVLRDDETGFGPIIRSTRISKLEYLAGRFLGAFAVAALCLLLVPLGIWLGTRMPWADPATLGPNRLGRPPLRLLPGRAAQRPRPLRGVLRAGDGHALDDGDLPGRHRLRLGLLRPGGRAGRPAAAGDGARRRRPVRRARPHGRHALLDGGRAQRDAARLRRRPAPTTACSGWASPSSAWRSRTPPTASPTGGCPSASASGGCSPSGRRRPRTNRGRERRRPCPRRGTAVRRCARCCGCARGSRPGRWS